MTKVNFIQPNETVMKMQIQLVGEEGEAYYLCECDGFSSNAIWESLTQGTHKNARLQLVNQFGRVEKTHNI